MTTLWTMRAVLAILTFLVFALAIPWARVASAVMASYGTIFLDKGALASGCW